MRRHIDKLILLALFALLACAVHAHTRFATAAAKPVSHPVRNLQPSIDRTGKFQLLFGAPEFALP
jgi:hypothetical protein